MLIDSPEKTIEKQNIPNEKTPFKTTKVVKFIIGLALAILVLVVPINQFSALPIAPLQDLAVQLDGRKKPLDTVARETVAQIHGKTSYTATDGTKLDLFRYLSFIVV